MHNGVVANYTDIRRSMLHLMSYDAFSNVLGSTDSEHAAAMYMTNLTKGGTNDTWQMEYSLEEMHKAMVQTVMQIMELQHEALGDKKAPNSLNFCATDGSKMVAIRFRNHATEQPPSLYWSEFAGRNLNQKYPGHPDGPHLVNEQAVKGEDEEIGKHTIIASEPTTHDENEWHLINKNCALTVDQFGTETEIPIKYDAKFNAKDPVTGN
jgi:glutamine amidotransferase